MRIGATLSPLVRFADSPPRLLVATQAGVAMLVAVGIPTLAGRQDLGLLASSGALSAVYLAGRTPAARARLLPLVQLGLLASAAFGVLAAATPAASTWLLCAFTIAAAVVSLALGIGPPGALFFVLVAGVSGRVAAAGVPALLLLVMVAAGCVVAYLVVVAPLLLPGHRRRPAAALATAGMDQETRIILGRLAAAAVLATALTALLGLSRVYWVLLTVVAVLQNGRGRRLTAVRGVHRLAGTSLGVGMFALLAVLRPSGLPLVLLIVVLQFGTELVIVRNYGLALVLITPLALLIAESSGADVLTTATTRVADTAVGAAAALLVLLLELAGERLLARRRSPA